MSPLVLNAGTSSLKSPAMWPSQTHVNERCECFCTAGVGRLERELRTRSGQSVCASVDFLSECSLLIAERRKLDHTVISGSTVLASFNLRKTQKVATRLANSRVSSGFPQHCVLHAHPPPAPTLHSPQPERPHFFIPSFPKP